MEVPAILSFFPAGILLVEPEEDPAFPVANLERMGFAVTRRGYGAPARDAMLAEEFDLILVDIPRVGAGTAELLELLQEFQKGAYLILLTSDPNLEALLDSLPLTIFHHLLKPAPKSRITRIARIALEHKRLSERVTGLDKTVNSVLACFQQAVILVNRDLSVERINARAQSVCGVPPSLVGQPLSVLGSDCAARMFELLKGVVREGRRIENLKIACLDAKGQNLALTVSANPTPDARGRVAGAVLVVEERESLSPTWEGREIRTRFHRLVGRSPAMQQLYAMIENLAVVDTTTLITGESGTGKELVAEALHYEGKRAKLPLVKVNCSALPDTLLESELFGHVKGAFTGAVKDRMGRFQLADQGTLFLDEIGDISPSVQVKLLRTLQESEFERLGDSRTLKVDVRIVAATNQDLKEKVRQGSFRQDLFYRLNVVELHVPPLRERREDLTLLADHFILKFNTKYGKSLAGFADGVMALFQDYPWPGNVRELEHVLEHAFVTCRAGSIKQKHLPKSLISWQPGRSSAPLSPPDSEAAEKEAIQAALEATHWKKNQTAKVLGISRSSLYRKMDKWKIG